MLGALARSCKVPLGPGLGLPSCALRAAILQLAELQAEGGALWQRTLHAHAGAQCAAAAAGPLSLASWHRARQEEQALQQPQPRPRRYSSAASDAGSAGGGGGSSSSSSSNAVLSNTTSFLRNLDNGAEVFLVGTAHVSRRSAEEVREMIRLVRPGTVMVELCPERAARLRQGQPASEMDFLKDMLSLLAPGGGGGGAAAGGFGQQLFKLSMQGMYRFLKTLGMDPGGEFKVAMEEAEALGASVVYGDRAVSETMSRLASSLSLQDVLRMLGSGGLQPPSQALVDFFNGTAGASFESRVEAMKTRALVREMSQYMRRMNPQLAAALIDERDQIMVDNLRKQQGRVVAVVGLAHLDGIERRWEELQHGEAAAVVRAC